MTRFDCVVVDADYEDLPDRSVMEELGASCSDGSDLFRLLNVVKVLRDVAVDQLEGDIFLADDAYSDFQRIIKEVINPELNTLKYCIAAGAQTSSWSKTKGKALKYSGGLFMLATADQICNHESVANFDFDTQSTREFRSLVEPLAAQQFTAQATGKLICSSHLKCGMNWALMFHETGLALQQCMVSKLSLPIMPPSVAVASNLTAGQNAPEQLATRKIQFNRSSFERPIQWGVHRALISSKFEDGVVSSSFMTVVCELCTHIHLHHMHLPTSLHLHQDMARVFFRTGEQPPFPRE